MSAVQVPVVKVTLGPKNRLMGVSLAGAMRGTGGHELGHGGGRGGGPSLGARPQVAADQVFADFEHLLR